MNPSKILELILTETFGNFMFLEDLGNYLETYAVARTSSFQGIQLPSSFKVFYNT